MSEPFISYAQNAEDVVLWRALKDVGVGRYVDVGAADPVDYSVTMAFYERGWRGVNVEPVPAFADALRRHRPHDIVAQCAAGAEEGTLELFVAEGTGLSTASADVADKMIGHGYTAAKQQVRVERLDSILERAGFEGSPIHFVKIDVEGFEGNVIRGFDLGRWRPWVLVVEATEPLGTTQTHGEWESLVTDAGYRFCLFDGLNRFYAAPDHPEVAERLSYPVCVFDLPYQRADVSLAIERNRGEWAGTIQHLRDVVERETADAAASREALRRRELEFASVVDRAAYLERQVGLLYRENLTLRGQVAEIGGVAHAVDGQRIAALGERDGYHQRLLDANAHLAALRRTVSWRVTWPLRSARRSLVPKRPTDAALPVAVSAVADGAPPTDERPLWEREVDATVRSVVDHFSLRIAQATALLTDQAVPSIVADGTPPMLEFEAAIAASGQAPGRVVWLALVAADGRYPTEADVRRASRRLRLGGPAVLVSEVVRRFDSAVADRRAPKVGLDIRRGQTLVDIAHTASNDLHTGIQRVVRQLCSRWFVHSEVIPVHWNHDDAAVMALADDERARVIHWERHLHAAGSKFGVRRVAEVSGAPVVPWDCRLVVPELAAEPGRCDGYRALATSGVLVGLSYLAYDLIPITAAETVAEGMPGVFANYLSTLKYADRVSAISSSSATDYTGFTMALGSQGLQGPSVAAHLLPADEPVVERGETDRLAADVALGGAPLVLVVGSHEPRKNHLVVLEAAEHLWREGQWFHLVFMGGSGWRSEDFDAEVDRLKADGRPVHVMKRVDEARLSAGYALARFTVFTSIVEGFGLPIAESLRCATPVITSDYGSMAEVASGGGAVLVDPTDPVALRHEMLSLLTDDVRFRTLSEEARRREWKSWDDYSQEVWEYLVPEHAEKGLQK